MNDETRENGLPAKPPLAKSGTEPGDLLARLPWVAAACFALFAGLMSAAYLALRAEVAALRDQAALAEIQSKILRTTDRGRTHSLCQAHGRPNQRSSGATRFRPAPGFSPRAPRRSRFQVLRRRGTGSRPAGRRAGCLRASRARVRPELPTLAVRFEHPAGISLAVLPAIQTRITFASPSNWTALARPAQASRLPANARAVLSSRRSGGVGQPLADALPECVSVACGSTARSAGAIQLRAIFLVPSRTDRRAGSIQGVLQSRPSGALYA